MNFDMQNDDRVQQNDIRTLDDSDLDLVQGGAGLLDIVKFVYTTVNSVLHMANGRPQL
jgi:hypothetical protein